MDFINKFTHQNNEEEVPNPSVQPSSHETQPVAKHGEEEEEVGEEGGEPKRSFINQLIAGSGHLGASHNHGHHGDDDVEGSGSFLDKITRKEEREKKAVELEKKEVELRLELDKVARERKDNEGLLDRIKDHFHQEEEGSGSGETKKKPHHEHEADAEPSFFDKLTGKDEREKKAAELDRREEELRAELEKVEHEKRENEGLLQRIKEHLEKDKEEAEEEREKDKKKLDGFLEKITGKAAEEERRRKEEENKNPFEKMKDKLNEEMGGGQKAEENEDLLDKSECHQKFFIYIYIKSHTTPPPQGLDLVDVYLPWIFANLINPPAIDKFQEYVLKEGDQSNESALEQMKDEKIAEAIRHKLHLKEKDEE